MAGATTLRPPFEHPLLNPSTGLVTEPWHLFFLRLQTANNGNAPADAEYVVGATNSYLTHERVGTNSTSISWDFATPGQAKVKRAALTGEVLAAADSNDTTLSTTGVTAGTYGDSTHVPQFTVDAKGRITNAASIAIDDQRYMPVFVGGIAVTSGDSLITVPWEAPTA